MSFFIQYCILLKNDSLLPILRFPGYFETPLFRSFFHFPWDFEIAGFNCSHSRVSHSSPSKLINRTTLYLQCTRGVLIVTACNTPSVAEYCCCGNVVSFTLGIHVPEAITIHFVCNITCNFACICIRSGLA